MLKFEPREFDAFQKSWSYVFGSALLLLSFSSLSLSVTSSGRSSVQRSIWRVEPRRPPDSTGLHRDRHDAAVAHGLGVASSREQTRNWGKGAVVKRGGDLRPSPSIVPCSVIYKN